MTLQYHHPLTYCLLRMVRAMVMGYVLACALVVFSVEPDSFDTSFDAVYWACVSLTIVGYGDIHPASDLGRVVAMPSSLMGVALIALPASIIRRLHGRDAPGDERISSKIKGVNLHLYINRCI